jgi:uncharacterized protein YhaN
MRIKRLEIYGYGKWVDTTFDLATDVHLFYGMNEAGKSTLMSFIHSILFGFPTRNSTLLRYEPRESSRYGGKIIAADERFGEVIIERIHGKVTGDVTVTLEDGATGTDELLDSVLYGMERETFQNIFSFSLADIEHVHQLNKNQLSRYLLNIGAHGTEYYLEMVDQFRKEADKLYRPSGRVLALNEQLGVLEKQEQRLADLEQRNEGYLDLIEKNKGENEALKTHEAEQKQVEKKRDKLLEMKKQWHVYEEIQSLTKEISKTDLPPLKKDGRYLLDEYKRNLAKVNEELQTTEKALKTKKEALTESDMLTHYEENQTTIRALENNLPEIVEELRDYENLREKRASTQKNLTRVEQTLGIEENPTYPTVFSVDEKAAVKDWEQSDAAAIEQQSQMTATIQTTENDLNLKNQRLDYYEEMMWDNQELKDVEAQLETAAAEEETAPNKIAPILSGLLGLVFAGTAFLVDASLQWLLVLLAGVAFVLAFVFYQKSSKKQTQPHDFLVKEYDKQLELKEEWREALGEVDALQENYQKQLQERDELVAKQQTLIEKWQQLLTKHQLPKKLDLNQADFIFEEVANLKELLTQAQEQGLALAELKASLTEKTNGLARVLDLPADASVQEQVTQFRKYLNKLKTVLAREEEKLEQLTTLRQELKRLEASKEATKQKVKDLIETAGAKNEDEFVQLYQEKDALDKKKSRLRFLKENAPEFEASETLPTKEEMALEEATFDEQLQKIEKEKEALVRKRANTQLSLEHLEKDGTYTEELQVFENEKAKAQRLVDEWASYKLAAGMIRNTLGQVTQDRFQEIIADAEDYFYLLTDEEYEKIVFKDEELFVQHQSGRVVDVRVLSRGTAEPLYVAIRLAYIKNTQDMMELPLIIDDPFVNFDRTRQKNMYQLLEQLGEEVQIIYFTFDPVARNYFTEQQITTL